MKKSSHGIDSTFVSPLDSQKRMHGDSRQAVATAWDEKVAQRIVDFEAGRTRGVPYEQVRVELRALIDGHDTRTER